MLHIALSKNLQPHLSLATDATDNGTYVAVVIGWKADIEKLHRDACKKLGVQFIHMVRIDDKRGAFNVLSNASSSIWMYCVKVDMPTHLIMLMKKTRGRTPKNILWNRLNVCTGFEIKKSIQPALVFFNKSFGELDVEADLDTDRVMKTIGIKIIQPAAAHQIADMVAWFNQAKNTPKTAREKDISQEVLSALKKRFNI